MIKRPQSGFTAVELLITLFVAAAFLIAGYQLFNVVIRDGGAARAESRAGNVAYDYLRRYAGTTTNPCTPSTPLSNYGVSVSGLTNVSVTIAITCPYSATNTLSEIEATITYNDPQETVKYTTYSYGESGGASAEILQGLIAWWPLNGNANTSVGTANGVTSGAVPTTGQNGQPNNAYSFDGIDDKIDAQLGSDVSGDYVHTVTFWIYPRSVTSSAGRADPYFLGLATDSRSSAFEVQPTQTYWYFFNNDTYTTSTIVSTNQWSFIALTYAGGGATTTNKKMYINGANINLTSGGGSYGQPLNLPASPTIGLAYDRGRNTAFFNGNIDDFRIYNRVLTPTEVQALYTNGAK
mgnify:CR=1 FL=1